MASKKPTKPKSLFDLKLDAEYAKIKSKGIKITKAELRSFLKKTQFK